MQPLFSKRRSGGILAAAFVVLLAGCSAESQAPPVSATVGSRLLASGGDSVIYPKNLSTIRQPGQRYPSWMRFGAKPQDWAFVVLQNATEQPWTGPEVLWYPENNKQNSPPACVTGNVKTFGTVGVDLSNTLWIPLISNNGRALIAELFTANCLYGSITYIEDPNGQPTAVAFDSNNGVYVENSTATGGGANIDVYPKRQAPPSTVLEESKASVAVGVALDKSNNVYMSWVDAHNVGHVDKFVGGQNPAVRLPMKIGYAGSVAFDKAGDLVVVDQSAGTADVFSHPFRSSPKAKIALKGLSLQCSFGHNWKQLYCADYEQGAVDVYKIITRAILRERRTATVGQMV